jgi:hypothetical protein
LSVTLWATKKAISVLENIKSLQMKKNFSIFFLLFIAAHSFAQENIKDFYALFSKQFTQMQNDEISFGVDTIIDLPNAYMRIQRKPNDCCHDYVVFTYFKTQAGEKVFALETGYGTTATDDHSTKFYSYTNKKWKQITKQVFPFTFVFKDFWIKKELPNKKFQKCKTHVELPKNGTTITVHIIPIDMNDYEIVFPKEKDAGIYDEMFLLRKYPEHFYSIDYAWDAQTGKFTFKQKLKEKEQ